MSNNEGFPSQEDKDDLQAEWESDTVPGFSTKAPEGKYFGRPIEPDWDSLLDD